MALSATNKYADKAPGLLRSAKIAGLRGAAMARTYKTNPALRLRVASTAKPVKPVRPAAPVYDPLAPLTPDQITARAQQDVYGPYNDIINATVAGLLGQAADQSDLERSQTARLMANLAPYANRIRGIFNTGAGNAAAAGQGIGSTLAVNGAQLSNVLAGKLAGIQAPGQAVSQIAGGQGQIGQAAGAILGALGSAEEQRLRGVGEANAGYAGALPGVAQLESLARLGLIQKQLSGDLVKQVGDLQIEAERAYMAAVKDYRDAEVQKANARSTAEYRAAQLKQAQAKQNALQAYRAQQIILAKQRNQISGQRSNDLSAQGWARVGQGNARVGIAQQNANTSAARLNETARQNAARNAQAAARLGISGQQLALAQRREDRLSKSRAGAKGGFTPGQVQKLQERAVNFAQDAFKGYQNDNGDTVYGTGKPAPYKPVEVWKWLLRRGIPPSIAQAAIKPYAPQVMDWYHPKAAAAPSGGVPGEIVLPTAGTWQGTHVTAGLGWGTKTAEDIMGSPGTPVGAPEDAVVLYFHPTGAQGGGSMELRTPSGRTYWLGHIANGLPAGTRVRRGQQVAVISGDHPRPHVHIDYRG